MNKQEHTFSILVQNEAGALTKIAQLFYRRGYNIETLTVGKTHRPGLSKILVSVPVDDRDVELLRRQLSNLQDVVRAEFLDRQRCIRTEVCLIRLTTRSLEERTRIMGSAHPYRPRLRAIDERSIYLEVSDTPEMIDDFMITMGQYEILDVARTGMTALGPSLEREACPVSLDGQPEGEVGL